MKLRGPLFAIAVLTAASCRQPRDAAPAPDTHEGSAVDVTSSPPLVSGGKFRRAFESIAQHFRDESRRDASRAAAHAGLSEACSTLWCFGYRSRAEARPEARAAAARAVALDDELPAAHTSVGIVKLCDWDWTGAEHAFRRAIQLDSDDAKAHHWLALYLSAMGRHEEAFAESTRAEQLEPLSPGFRTGKGAVLYFAHRFEEMRKQMLGVVSRAPDFPWGHDWLGMALVQLGRFDRAIDTYETAVKLSDRTAEVLAGLGHACGVAGRASFAREILEELERDAENGYVPPVQRAYVCLSLGDEDRAFELLEEAYADRSWELVFLREEPWFDTVRSDPRFVRLQQRMRFPRPPD